MLNDLFKVCVPILFLAGCTTDPSQRTSTAPPITAEQFRHLYPIDERFVDSVLGDYAKVQKALLDAGTSGARAVVSLETGSGPFHFGYDEFFTGDIPRTKEVRDNYTAVQVGTSLCMQEEGKEFLCKTSSPLHLGLPSVDKVHVARIWSRNVSCVNPVTACRFIKVQLSSAESDVNSTDGFSADPNLVGHDYEVVFSLITYLPIYLRQTDHYHVGATAIAYYGFQFNTHVEAINLPQAGGTLP